jgi:hypothetical protein
VGERQRVPTSTGAARLAGTSVSASGRAAVTGGVDDVLSLDGAGGG